MAWMGKTLPFSVTDDTSAVPQNETKTKMAKSYQYINTMS